MLHDVQASSVHAQRSDTGKAFVRASRTVSALWFPWSWKLGGSSQSRQSGRSRQGPCWGPLNVPVGDWMGLGFYGFRDLGCWLQVELPLGATEDRICGTIDIEKALQEGVKAYEPGLLVRCATRAP